MNTNRKKQKKRQVSIEEIGTCMTGPIVTHSSGVTSMTFLSMLNQVLTYNNTKEDVLQTT